MNRPAPGHADLMVSPETLSPETFPYVRRHVTAPVADRFHFVRRLIQAVPQRNLPFMLSCHALCHALRHRVHGVQVARGYFSTAWEHSWLTTEDRGRRFIIDPYPWAALGGPQLLLDDPRTPWRTLYRPDPSIGKEPDEEQVSWLISYWERRPLTTRSRTY